jgi:hypothetical protein
MSERAFRVSVVLLLSAILVLLSYASLRLHGRPPTVGDLAAAGNDEEARRAVWARLPVVLLKGSLDTITVCGAVDVLGGQVDVSGAVEVSGGQVEVSGAVDVNSVGDIVDVRVSR